MHCPQIWAWEWDETGRDHSCWEGDLEEEEGEQKREKEKNVRKICFARIRGSSILTFAKEGPLYSVLSPFFKLPDNVAHNIRAAHQGGGGGGASMVHPSPLRLIIPSSESDEPLSVANETI